MEIILESLSQVLIFWWIIPIALIVGMFLGAVPGFSSTNGLIILLPLTLSMESAPALSFMVSVYAGSHMGGSIPAILLNVPGTGSSAVTCFDGYPMTQKGQAQQALAIAFVASSLGGLLTTTITLSALSYLSIVVYYFRSVENFIIILFGIALIAQVSGDNLLKGIFSGVLGLLIGAIGYDHIYSVPRASFGMLELYDGIPRVAALIGLFAIAEALIMIEKEKIVDTSKLDEVLKEGWKGTFEGISMALRDWFGIIRSSLIGFIVGIIPGAGATIGSFVSYQQAMTFSKHKEKYGTGYPPGVVASEAANNGLTSGTLIPMLTLGIPGGGTAAVMIIVLQAHGVPIGPRLFQVMPHLAYNVVVALMLAYFWMMLIGIPFSKVMSKMSYFSTKVLAPTILSFTLIGAFVGRRFIFDMNLALIFGIIGYLMKKTGYNNHALLLGIILGPMAEEYFLRCLLLGQGSLTIFFSTPVANVLWGLLIISLVGPTLFSKIKQKLSEK